MVSTTLPNQTSLNKLITHTRSKKLSIPSTLIKKLVLKYTGIVQMYNDRKKNDNSKAK